MTKINIYKYVLAFSAFLISGTAAFFSVYGISSLFAGSSIAVSIMAGSLEIGKLVVASFLYRYWNDVTKILKGYFLLSTIVLVIITSSGIFGYLSNAYAKTSSDLKSIDERISVLESKKKLIVNEKKRTEYRVSDISNIRNNQESRINNLYGSNQNANAKRIEQSSSQLNNQVFLLNSKLDSLDNEISKVENKILDEQSSISKSDVGPLKYIAGAFNTNIDTVVKFFILILIFVFDPLAVSLIIAFNIVLKKESKEKEEKESKEKSIDSKLIENNISENNDIDENLTTKIPDVIETIPDDIKVSENQSVAVIKDSIEHTEPSKFNEPIETEDFDIDNSHFENNKSIETEDFNIDNENFENAEPIIEEDTFINDDKKENIDSIEHKIKSPNDDDYIKLLENGNSDHTFYHDDKKEKPIPEWKSSNYKD